MKNYHFYLMLFLFVVVTSCNKDEENPECPCTDPTNPECPNYDPCFGKDEPNARFFIEDRLIYPEFGEYLWINDSILRGGPVRFRSPFEGEGISHIWYVGAEIIEEPTVTRNFAVVQRPEFITVSHVITYPIDTLCYPEALGRDSISQTFYLIDFYSELLTIENTFRGVLNNETDSFDFKFRALQGFTGVPGQISTSGVNIYSINFHNSQDSVRNDGVSFTNTHLSLTNDGPAIGLLIINPEDLSVELNYSFEDDDTQHKFLGRVIPE
jgi:hypothetical protein